MSRILQQTEIDAIFRGPHAPQAKPGGEGSNDVVPYSFSRPRRISRERRGALEAIFARFAEAFGSWLSLRLRGPAQVEVSSVELAASGELLLSLGTPCAAFLFRSGKWRGLLDLGIGAALIYVDRLIGGRGEPCSPPRPLTEIEERIARGMAERALQILTEAAEEEIPIAPAIETFEPDPEQVDLGAREQNMIVAIFEVRFGAAGGLLTLSLPLEAVEPFLRDRAQVRNPREACADAPPGSGAGALVAGLAHASLSVAARLPVLHLSAAAIAGLSEGQIIQTDHPVDSPVEILVNGRVRYFGSLGQRAKRLALRVTDIVSVPAAERPERVKEGRIL